MLQVLDRRSHNNSLLHFEKIQDGGQNGQKWNLHSLPSL